MHGLQVIGAEVPVSPERPATATRARKGQKNRSPPAGMGRTFGFYSGQPGRGAGRDDLPVARRGSRISSWDLVSEAGRERDYPKKGRGTSNGLERGLRFSIWPDVERQANLREAQSSRSQGFSSERAVRWKATPELVSQDREAGCQTFRGAGPGRPNTGISFARRSGGWQQCRPPFLFGALRVPFGTSPVEAIPLNSAGINRSA